MYTPESLDTVQQRAAQLSAQDISQYQDKQSTEQHVCPHCGYCPCCGRRN